MSTTVSGLLDEINTYRNNPSMIQRSILGHLKEVTAGRVSIVDPSNPFVFALEATSVATAAFMTRSEVNTRKQYPYSALTEDDLYLHMSDKDYIGRFAIPADGKFTIIMRKDELINRLVPDPETGYSKIVLPRNSYVTINGMNFGLEYPIEIRQLNHGGLQIVYDASIPSPIQELTTNVIEWTPGNRDGVTYVMFDFATKQFNIISQIGSTSPSAPFQIDIPFNDQFYFARVYMKDAANEKWIEIPVTHTEQIYDIATVTAVLKVTNGNLNVKLPQIYTNMLGITRAMRVDLYETRGNVNIILDNYPMDAFSYTWKAIDTNEQTIFTSPLSQFESMQVFSTDIVNGGRDALAFEELRERVILNALGTNSLPITNAQIEKALIDSGYEIVKGIDILTNRVFLATRELPAPTQESLITAAAASIQTALFSMSDVAQLASVIDNNTSITITPETLYQNVNGRVNFVSDTAKQALMNLSVENRANAVTSGGYYYSPFHYVLDLTQTDFDVRAYYLDKPTIKTKIFVAENDKTLYQVTIGSYKIVKSNKGYKIQIATQSSEDFKALEDGAVIPQLSFTPVGERDRAYLNGTFIGRTEDEERLFEFDLSSTFNVTNAGGLILTKFMMYTVDPKEVGSLLQQDFDVFFTTTEYPGDQYRPSAIDDELGKFLLPSQIYGVSHERLRVSFGQYLKNLWVRARSYASDNKYQTYKTDVPMLYEEDVYERDPVTGSTIKIVDGKVVTTLLHAKGDPVLDDQGAPRYKYRAGDTVLDVYNRPVIENPRGMYRQIDFMLIEGPYYFATDSVAIAYRQELTDTLVKWIVEDLATITPALLEQTRIYFYPKTTTGLVNVMYSSGLTASINAGQAFVLNLHVHSDVYGNEDLRAAITRKTISVINEALQNSVVSMSAITSALRDAYSGDVIDVQISGLGGQANYSTLTILDDMSRCSIRKRLVAQPDGYLIVSEDVVVNFIRHELNT